MSSVLTERRCERTCFEGPMLRKLGSIYVNSGRNVEQALKKATHRRKGGLTRATGANLSARVSFRTLLFFSDSHKPDSLQRQDHSGRDVFGRQWYSTTHDMDDLSHGLCGIEQAQPQRFDTVDRDTKLMSNEKPQDGSGSLTRLTRLTSNRGGCTCRAAACPRAPARPGLDTYPSVGVKSVKSVNLPTPLCGFSIDGTAKTGVNLTPTPRFGVEA